VQIHAVPESQPGRARRVRAAAHHSDVPVAARALPTDLRQLQLRDPFRPNDIYDLDLLGTELVVLSACATGLGRYHPGEGIFGLRRDFEIVGVRSVLVTIWDVPSSTTVLLMREFYRGLLRGNSRTAALHAAQQAVRRRFPGPAAWAPFALFGDPAAFALADTKGG
jgi:CHAT domain-containing protein